jgi:predicted transcriptional regulator
MGKIYAERVSYGNMNQWERLLYSVVDREERLDEVVGSCLDELNLSVPEFCEHADLSESTMYKIVSGHRQNIQLDNFQKIVRALKRIEQGRELDERTVAVVTNRESLEEVRSTVEMDDYEISIEGYPSATVEEALKQSIIAERDGVDAIICGPITAYTLEDVLYTPVVGLNVGQDQIEDAVATTLKKI